MSGRRSRLADALLAAQDFRRAQLDLLTDRQYEFLVRAMCDLWGTDAARLFLGRWLREQADSDEERAA